METPDFPSNSNSSKKPTKKGKDDERPKIESVVKGNAIRRKKSLGKRFAETFLGGESTDSVWRYLVADVLVPAAKDTISDAVSQGVNRKLFGEGYRVPSRGRSRAGNSQTNYQRMSNQGSAMREEAQRSLSRRGRTLHEFDEVVIPTRAEAEEVLTQMFDILEAYDEVKVSDFYDLCEITSTPADQNYGWTKLSDTGVSRVRDGYLINLPKPEPLGR